MVYTIPYTVKYASIQLSVAWTFSFSTSGKTGTHFFVDISTILFCLAPQMR